MEGQTRRLRRLFDMAYAHVQNHAWLKRLAVRLMLQFPTLGSRVLANVGVPAHAQRERPDMRPFDAAARECYLRYGYRPILRPDAERHVATRQLLVDISGLVQRDAGTGIQRVVRNLTRALVELDLPGWRVEPIYIHRGRFRYARKFVTRVWQLPNLQLEDEPVNATSRDVFFTPDLALLPINQMRKPLEAWRSQGLRLHFVLYDLIPILHPEFYQGEVDPRFARWIETVLDLADSVQCISQAVASDLRRWLEDRDGCLGRTPPTIGWFHLGAQLELPESSGVGPVEAQTTPPATLPWSRTDGRTLLMVGTLEPRKGHAQVLDAMERLWARDEPVNLLIIGKVGWNVHSLVERLRRHPQYGRRLHWQSEAADEDLYLAYRTSAALIAASYAEGFGLPLIEAAQHDLPIIARDLPVFREVAQEHAWYFQAHDAESLAQALLEWLRLDAQGVAPRSGKISWLTWEESAAMLTRAILPQQVKLE